MNGYTTYISLTDLMMWISFSSFLAMQAGSLASIMMSTHRQQGQIKILNDEIKALRLQLTHTAASVQAASVQAASVQAASVQAAAAHAASHTPAPVVRIKVLTNEGTQTEEPENVMLKTHPCDLWTQL